MDSLEYDQFFEEVFQKEFGRAEDHEFVRFNESLGIHTYGKDHFKMEMKKRRMLPFEASLELASRKRRNKTEVNYKNMPEEYKDIIHALRLTADKHGNIKIEGRAFDALFGLGAIKKKRNIDMSQFNPEKGGVVDGM